LHIRGRADQVLQQRRLADPGLAPQHQRLPASRPDIPEKAVKRRPLLLPVQ
jgi:hypothetical protein